MAILALADFERRPYRIPNQEESKDLLAFIQAEEEKTLREILGTALYDEFVAGIAIGSPLQKWIDLRDGANYTFDSIEYKFRGLKALLIPKVYCEWLRTTRDKYTDVGVVVNKAENNELIGPTNQIIQAYNDFARQVGDYYNQQNSLYGFITANEANYADWEFIYPGRLNDFGL